VADDRPAFDAWPAAVYAVGDVHGCLDQLVELEGRIVADGEGIGGEKWIVMLGDYIDRGPHSAAVVAHLLRPPPAGFRRFALRGNHEQMMLDFLADPEANLYWLDQGGWETLASYGIEAALKRQASSGTPLAHIAERIPASHRAFMASLPVLLSLPGWLFVHAGVRPGIGIDRQDAEDLIWIRGPFLDGPGMTGVRVVHGHTPGPEPVFTPARIGIDTQCYLTGRLTGLRVTPDGATKIIAVGPASPARRSRAERST
jgi:serine/threonine protein phosphatase 1